MSYLLEKQREWRLKPWYSRDIQCRDMKCGSTGENGCFALWLPAEHTQISELAAYFVAALYSEG